MKILMVTNSFTPLVGGVARSVEAFSARLRGLGHRVCVAAPEYEGIPAGERDVIRVPAIRKWHGSEFSLPLPVTRPLRRAARLWGPDLIHSHHPFLLGDTALRMAIARPTPIVFTHHTWYEAYTHYVPGDPPGLKRYVADLATGYANLCDAVIAPSEGVSEVLRSRGVSVPIEVLPTGVEIDHFASGDGAAFRERWSVPAGVPLVGHVGRLCPEKNLEFLACALAEFAERTPGAHVLIVGEGPGRRLFDQGFRSRGLRSRLRFTGELAREKLPDAYAATDIFAFASHTETQGMVLTEAMAAGVPVVALDACGVRDVVLDRCNGRLLCGEDVAGFAAVCAELACAGGEARSALQGGARETAGRFSMDRTAAQLVALYERVLGAQEHEKRERAWGKAQRCLVEEWKILANRVAAAERAWLERPSAELDRTVL